MSLFEEYVSQGSSDSESDHYDEHSDMWVDEGSEPYGHSGYCDVHTDEAV